MRKILSLLSFLIFLSPLLLSQEKMNEQVLNQVRNSTVSTLYPQFNQEMKNAMDSSEIDGLWISLTSRYGEIDSIGTSVLSKKDSTFIYVSNIFYKKMALTLHVAIAEKDSIAGIFLRPYVNKNNYQAPTYANYNSFTESKGYVYSDVYLLPYMLTLPKDKGPFPLVILVHGSGPQDMDVSVGSNKVFRDISYGLASKGIAVLRYDKRTFAYKKEIAKDIDNLGIYEETVNDAVQAAYQMKKDARIDPNRIFILGHSQGGMMAPEIYKEADFLKGIILLGAPARSLASLILEQQYYLAKEDSNISDEEKEYLVNTAEMVTVINNPRKLKKSKEESFFGLSKYYWMSFNNYKQWKVANKYEPSMLVLHGSRDFQVSDIDYELWQEKLKVKDVTFHRYDGLNHMMMMGEGPGTLEEYYIPGNVDVRVIKDITEWIKKH